MNHRIFPAGDRGAFRLAAAIDKLLGYPREDRPGENGIRNVGMGGRHPKVVRTETHAVPLVHSDGRTAYPVDDVVRELVGRTVEIEDPEAPIGRVLVTIASSPAAPLPGARSDWDRAAARGGLRGAT